MDEIVNIIKANQLLVRPSLTGGWVAGKWLGVTGDGKSYCEKYTEVESFSLESAVLAFIEKSTIQTNSGI